MAHYRYQIFVPGGNKTALVFGTAGLETDPARRKEIQDCILARHEHDPDGEVEQVVGFISTDVSAPELIMTGGEFCGNATRTAAAYYLGGRAGEVTITVSGASKPLQTGGSETGEIWAEMPVFEELVSAVTPVSNGGYWVEMDGISHLILPQFPSEPYLRRILSTDKSKEEQLNIALALLEETIAENALSAGDAYGVMFLEPVLGMLKIHPFVHVKAAGTTYYETGCGSGTICVGLVSSLLRGGSEKIRILQPSNKTICAEIEQSADGKVRGKISGPVERGEIYEIEVIS